MTKASLLSRAGTMVAAVVLSLPTPAFAAKAKAGIESTPVHLGGGSQQHATHVGGSGSIVRTIVGLAIVIGVIYGVAWVLKQVKAGKQERATGSGLASLASVPLGSGRSVHLVRAGRELVLVGVGEHGVTPIRVYAEQEARDAGLVDEHGMVILPGNDIDDDDEPRRPRKPLTRRLALPAGRLALPAGRLTLPKLALPAPRRTDATAVAAARPMTATHVLDTLRAWTVRS
jgi:flagellar protein FliO/FliZ